MVDEPVIDEPVIDEPGGSVGEDEETPGLAGERTDLAWSRSALAAVVAVAALARKLIGDFESRTAAAIVAIVLIAGAVAWTLALANARVVVHETISGRAIAEARRLRIVAVGSTSFAVAAALIALVPAR